MELTFSVAAFSDMGLVRKNNEDNLFVPFAEIKDRFAEQYEYFGEFSSDKAFFCVCDGMGGHNAGEIASEIAVNQVSINYDAIISNIKNKRQLENIMSEFVKNANMTISDYSEENPECAHMGTTMCGVFFMGGNAYGVNVGDSRLYSLNGRKIYQISIDHADAVHTNAITRYLGMPEEYGDVAPDVLDPVKIGRKKRFLICSDGLSDMLGNSSIETVLRSAKDPVQAAKNLVEEAKKVGGRDNITVIVIDAKPKNSVIRAIKNPALTAALAAVLVAGGIGLAVYNNITAPVEGDLLEEVASNIQNVKNLEEADNTIRSIPPEFLARVEKYKGQNNTFQSGLDDALTAAKQELEFKIAEFEEKTALFKQEVDATIANEEGRSDEERLEREKTVTSWGTYLAAEAADKECEAAVKAAQAAKNSYDQKQEEIKRIREQKPTGDSSGGSVSKSGGSSNSGGSGSKSGGSSSSGGSGTKNGGSSSSGSSGTKNGGSSSSGSSGSKSGGSSGSGGSGTKSGGSSSSGGSGTKIDGSSSSSSSGRDYNRDQQQSPTN